MGVVLTDDQVGAQGANKFFCRVGHCDFLAKEIGEDEEVAKTDVVVAVEVVDSVGSGDGLVESVDEEEEVRETDLVVAVEIGAGDLGRRGHIGGQDQAEDD